MTFWQTFQLETEKVFALWLVVELIVVVAAVRASGKETVQQERHRIRAGTILVVIQLSFTLLTTVLRYSTDRLWRDFQLLSLVFGAFASVGLASTFLFAIVLPRARLVAPIILRDVITGVASVVTALAIATRAGFDWSGVLATSAVLTAVIGFSLQDLLANVAGGLTLQLDESIKVGDWIKLGDVVGRITEIRWRYTAVETRNWETVYIPNSMITKGQLIVLGKRLGKSRQWRRWVWFNVDFRHSPSDVITVVTRALIDARCEHVSDEPPPNCVLMDLGESYGKYAVRYWLTDLAQDDPTDSAVRTRIFYALRRANIALSMPAYATFVTKETSARKTLKQAQEHERRLSALKKIGLFNRLPEDVLEHLADGLIAAPFAPGEVLTRQGAEAHWLYMIVHGEASVRVRKNGGPEAEVNRLADGSFFGEMSLLTGQPREATIVALSDVDCYRLDRALAYEVLTQRPEFAEYIAEVMARRHVLDANAAAPLDRETEAKRVDDAKVALLARIRHFFALDDEDQQVHAKA